MKIQTKKKISIFFGILIPISISFFLLRPMIAFVSSLIIGEKIFFISTDKYGVLSGLGIVLFALLVGWKIASCFLEKESKVVSKIIRNILFFVSLVLVVVGSVNFYAFSNDKIISISSYPKLMNQTILYKDIQNVEVSVNFYTTTNGTNRGPKSRSCSVKIPIKIFSNGQVFDTVISRENIEKFGIVLLTNEIPYQATITNDCSAVGARINSSTNFKIERSFNIKTGF